MPQSPPWCRAGGTLLRSRPWPISSPRTPSSGILRRRHEAVAGSANSFNRDLAELLVQIAREWAKVDAEQLTKLKSLTSKVPVPASGLTAKTKRSLRQFDDPAVRHRLTRLPAQLWSEVKRDQATKFPHPRQGAGRARHRHTALHAAAAAESPRSPVRCACIPARRCSRNVFAGAPGGRGEEQDGAGVRYPAACCQDADRIS